MVEKKGRAAFLQTLAPSNKGFQGLKRLPLEGQTPTAFQLLEKLYHRLPSIFDRSIFKELDRLTANLEDDYTNQRPSNFFAKLAYSICWIRKKISRDVTLSPLKDHYDIRLFASSLHFTFGSKPVLGVLAHAHLKNKYESLDEEHLLFAIRKTVSEAQLIKGSVYLFQSPQTGIKTLYFEVDKRSGLPFTSDEIRRLKRLLKQEIKYCVEHLAPLTFMTRNEEEVLRNILTLSREIHQFSDLPQVMISFDRQTSQEAIFTIILVRVCYQGQTDVSEYFMQPQEGFTYFSERYQIVSYLEKIHPIEAHVFRIHLIKDLSLLRSDLSLNFYLARQKITALLLEAIGEFRDFNGGMILKQRERLVCFNELFPQTLFQNPDLIENFFYSISPIEAQATLPLSSLQSLFELFLEALDVSIVKPSDYFLKSHQTGDQLFLMIRTPDVSFKETVEQIFTNLQLNHLKTAESSIHLQNTYFLGYIITPTKKQNTLLQAVIESARSWQHRIENRQILKLALENPIVSLDPRIGGDHISSLLLKLLFEGLMRENREGTIEYGIAKKVHISPDLKSYTFLLRTARWSDGSLVSAFDFEYAWKKILSPNFKTPFAYLFYPIKNAKLAKEGVVSIDTVGIQAVNDLSLKVDLRSPTPYFLELTAHPIYSPVHRLKDQLHPNWSHEEGDAYTCNGAFILKRNQSKEHYELAKNPLYWDSQNIKLDQVIVLKADRHQAYEMFQKNQSHWHGIPLSTLELNSLPHQDDEMITFPNKNRVYWCVFNSQHPPFNNKRLRQAFALAINREDLALIFNAVPAVSPLPLSHSLIQQSILSTFNLNQARFFFKKALEELGLPLEDFPTITFMHLASPIWNKACERMKECWEQAFNIQCNLLPLEWNFLFSKITQGDFQLGGIAWQPWVNDPMYTLNAFREGKEPLNFAKWDNSRYQEILYLAERETDLHKRKSFYLQAEECLLEEMPIAPIFSDTPRALKKKHLRLQQTSILMNFKWAYLENLQN